MSKDNLDRIYEYDDNLKQYRRKYPREAVSPDDKNLKGSSNIYSTVASDKNSMEFRSKRYRISRTLWKLSFWILFFVGVLLWVAFLFYAFTGKEDKKITDEEVTEKEFVIPTIPGKH